MATTALLLMGATWGRSAAAWCRTTICPKCPYDDAGCPTELPVYWPTSCVTFSMQYGASKQVDLATATQVMERAFGVWQEVSCADSGGAPSIRIDHHFGDAACKLHEYNQADANANIIIFRDDKWPYDGAANVLALTTVTYSIKTGAILDVDMEVNATQPLSVGDPVPSTSYDLQSIVTHEAGHFLGLAHSTDRTATMWPQYTSGTQSFRMLALDDAEGICAAYPSSTPAQCNFTPRQGFATECGIFPSGNGGKCALAKEGPAANAPSAYRWIGFTAVLGAIGLVSRRRRRGHAEGR